MTRQIEFSLPEYRYGFHLITSQILSKTGELPESGLRKRRYAGAH
jgi:hypothetical protein